jgi:ribosomal protein S18 acetylase RimI-like enzyme
MDKCLSYQLGEYEVMGKYEMIRLGELFSTSRRFSKIFVCPNCLKSIHLGRNSEDEKWEYDADDTHRSENTLSSKTEKGFKIHVKKCKSVLSCGINRIDFNSSEKAHYIVCQLARFSMNETGWANSQVHIDDFRRKNEVVAYVLVNEVGPIGYVAFRLKTRSKKEQITSLYFLWDLYIFPTFRKRGLATKLVEYGIKDLGINKSTLPVSCPLTESSINIVKNIASDKIILFKSGEEQHTIDKDDIEKCVKVYAPWS